MATVITNMASAVPYIGTDLVQFLWGGFSVDNATLNRFFSLHYLLPFLITALVVVHLLALHIDGSTNPLGISSNGDKISFHPYYTYKDLLGFVLFIIFFVLFVFFAPNVLGRWMAPIYWKIYGAMNKMRESIISPFINGLVLYILKSINRTQYCVTMWLQVKIWFLDTNSQASWNSKKGASETKFKCSNLKLNWAKLANLYRFFFDLLSQFSTFNFGISNRIKSNQYILCDFGTKNFNQWFAGLMDADGYIYYNSKLNIITIEITMATQDILALKAIKERFGGSINKRTGSNSYRWRISSRNNVIKILQSINGDLLNPVRIAQFNKVSKILNINSRPARHFSLESAWLTGFFDGDGTIILLKRPKENIGCRGIQISFSQKEKYILELMQKLIGGSLHFDKSSPGWKLSISSKSDILNLYSFFQHFPSLTSKNHRLSLIPEIYRLQYNKETSPQDWELLYNNFYKFSNVATT